jgi:uncharacterized protein (TIGR02145 family)
MNTVGGASTAGTKLKSSTGWISYSGITAGTDDYGWSALPGGYGYSGGSFNSTGYYGYWWSATERYAGGGASYWRMDYDNEYVYRSELSNMSLWSVRCVQD